MKESDDLVKALAPVAAALQHLAIPYYVGGSIASSYHGAVRSTMDVDLVCELPANQISSFLAQFDDQFYVSADAVRQAVQNKSCFNLIHLPTGYKVDLFVSRGRTFDNQCMARAQIAAFGSTEKVYVPVASAEDAIIIKLEWFRLTNETSERQWDDVFRLIRILGDGANLEYLRNAAESVGVEDLLEKLLKSRTRSNSEQPSDE